MTQEALLNNISHASKSWKPWLLLPTSWVQCWSPTFSMSPRTSIYVILSDILDSDSRYMTSTAWLTHAVCSVSQTAHKAKSFKTQIHWFCMSYRSAVQTWPRLRAPFGPVFFLLPPMTLGHRTNDMTQDRVSLEHRKWSSWPGQTEQTRLLQCH